MTDVVGRALARLLAAEDATTDVVLAALFSLGARSLLLAALDRSRGPFVAACRVLAGAAWLAAGAAYLVAAPASRRWGGDPALAGGVTALVLLGPWLLRSIAGRAPAFGLALGWGVVLQAALAALIGAAGVATLIPAGFSRLVEDQPLLTLDVTGETGTQLVRWAAPDQAGRSERLITHRVVVRQLDGSVVAEAWIYGDEVAVKGRVLRFSPALNALGVANLYELQFLHNGYERAERHSEMPHVALALPPIGPLSVHPLWRPWQRRLLASWERRSREGSPWGVRSVVTESTYFPLTDADGRAVTQSFRLVLTPGGLSSG